LLLQLIVLGIPAVHNAFKLEMLNARGWMNVIVIGFIPIGFNEIAKVIMRKEAAKSLNIWTFHLVLFIVFQRWIRSCSVQAFQTDWHPFWIVATRITVDLQAAKEQPIPG
jgi:Cation transporting ATPase, C-terminus